MKNSNESEIILSRMEDICPPDYIQNKSFEELILDVNVSFKIIGYSPNNLRDSVKKAYEKMNGEGELYRLCYNTWRLD